MTARMATLAINIAMMMVAGSPSPPPVCDQNTGLNPSVMPPTSARLAPIRRSDNATPTMTNASPDARTRGVSPKIQEGLTTSVPHLTKQGTNTARILEGLFVQKNIKAHPRDCWLVGKAVPSRSLFRRK